MLAKILFNVIIIALLLPPVMPAQSKSDFQLSHYQWKNRLLLVFAPSQENDDYRKQFEELNGNKKGMLDRDLKIVHLFSNGASFIDENYIDRKKVDSVYRSFKVTPGHNTVVLIGKDGTEKLRTGNILRNEKLFSLIDSMPMRRREMREQGE